MIVSNSKICEKCKTKMDYHERIKITSYEFVEDPQCSGSLNRTVDSFNLCRDCYKKYNEFMLDFFKTKFTQFRK